MQPSLRKFEHDQEPTSYFSMAAYVSILRKLISWSFYNRVLPKSNLKSGSAPVNYNFL